MTFIHVYYESLTLTTITDTHMNPILLSLPDDLADWRGTAAELADRLQRGAGRHPLARPTTRARPTNASSATTCRWACSRPPEREGREALFGLRQVVEFLAARYLLKDGWPLAKVAEIVRTTDVDGLAQMIPTERPRTPRRGSGAKYRAAARRGARAATIANDKRRKRVSAETFALDPGAAARRVQRAAVQQAMKLETPLVASRPASRAAACRSRRTSRRSATPPAAPTAAASCASSSRRGATCTSTLATLGEMSEDTPDDPRGRVDPGAPGRAHTKRKVTMTTPTMIITARRPALLAGHDNELDVLVRVQAPDAPAELPKRNPLHLALVIDRSGSMSGQPLDEAKRCAEFVLDGLQPTDRLSVVVYDDQVQTLVPTMPLARQGDRCAARSARSTPAAPPTCTAAGSRAPRRSRRTPRTNITSRVILLSDGCANHGLVDHDPIYAQCADFARAGVTTSTYGLGHGFNEELMIGMARHGQGSSYYGQTADDLMDPFREEFELLNALCARRLRLEIEPAPGVKAKMLNDYVADGDERVAAARTSRSAAKPGPWCGCVFPLPLQRQRARLQGLLSLCSFSAPLHHPRRRAPRDPADVARAAGAPRLGVRRDRRGRAGRTPHRRTRGGLPADEGTRSRAAGRLGRRGAALKQGRAHRREQPVGGGVAQGAA